MGGTTQTDGRRERSRRTAAKIVTAARRRFVENGYVETTVESIAEAACVSPQTVYYVFGTKPRLLDAALDATIAGDDQPVALIKRGWVDAVETATDAEGAVRAIAALAVAVLARVEPMLEVARRAASVPEVAAIYDETRRRRRLDQRQLVELLAGHGHLRDGLAVDDAADVVYALMSEELMVSLVTECGWSVERFGDWFADTLVAQLV
ncbi:TetR/AcrR family transcriptional regulator [Desertimonas flava]|uniref:TetR/AcrR family transcriptional regulator n=1 Tax=Desertimonas flava TaxID=2064846 RepID=UPI000E355B1A|nr:TetR/AcrR family transcriptional regulator [Desertimonas flava]